MELQQKKPTGWQWPAFIVGLLLVPVVGNVVLVMKATGDPSFVIEEDYYRKAVQWDQTMAQEQHNQALGWSVEVSTTPQEVAGKPTTVSVVVKEANGLPIRDAVVGLEVFHNARSARRVTSSMVVDKKDVYHANLDLRRPGLHEFRVDVQRGADRFTYTTQQDVVVRTGRESE